MELVAFMLVIPVSSFAHTPSLSERQYAVEIGHTRKTELTGQQC